MGPKFREEGDGDGSPSSGRASPRRSRAPRRDRDVSRIFIAAYPPSSVVDALATAIDSIEDLPAHRRVPRTQIHLTVQFVGDVDRRDLDRVIETVERGAAGVDPFEVAADRWVTLPERGPSRLIAAAAPEVAALSTLHERLSKRLARRRSGGEKFLPHLTLLRFRSPVPGFRFDRKLVVEPIPVRSIVVVQSVLRPEGADHRALAEIPL